MDWTTKAADGFYTGDVLNHLYYVSDGRIATKGWLNVDGNWYYFEEKDYLGIYYAVAGTNETIDGKLYHFNSDGVMASSVGVCMRMEVGIMHLLRANYPLEM